MRTDEPVFVAHNSFSAIFFRFPVKTFFGDIDRTRAEHNTRNHIEQLGSKCASRVAAGDWISAGDIIKSIFFLF